MGQSPPKKCSVCSLIIEQIEDKNPGDEEGWTPLHSAAFGGHIEIFSHIWELVENKYPTEIGGTTPLHWAAHEGHEHICRFILEHGGDKNPVDEDGNTALDYAMINLNDTSICAFLREHFENQKTNIINTT